MVRIMFAAPPVRGHVTALLGTAETLIAGGHAVEWLSQELEAWPSTVAVLESITGLTVRNLVHQGPSFLPQSAGAGTGPNEKDARYQRLFDLGITAAPLLVPQIREAIRSFSPNVMVIDGMAIPYLIAASLERVPYACLSNLTIVAPRTIDCDRFAWNDRMKSARDALFASYGIDSPEFRAMVCVSPFLNTCFTTEAFLGKEADVPANVHLVGPSRSPNRHHREEEIAFAWDRLSTDRPIICMAMGSIYTPPPNVILSFAAAAKQIGAQLVLSTRGLDPELVAELPAEVVAASWIPQVKVLERSAAFVTHAATNGINEALDFGVPVFAIPLASDQPIGAHFARAAKFGVTADPHAITQEVARHGLEQLLADPTFRANAQRVQASFRRLDSSALCSKYVLSLAH